MKLLAFLSLVIVAFTADSMSPLPGEKPDRIPDFYVLKTEKDPTLDVNHARFVVHFSFEGRNEYKTSVPTIELSCNGVIRTFALDSTNSYSIDVSPGKYSFMVSAGPQYYEVFSHEISINGEEEMEAMCTFSLIERRVQPIISYKPVIYTYSDKNAEISLTLNPIGEFTFTYPEYNEKWSGTAHADGSFTTNDKTYPYLFWEGESNHLARLQDFSEGFLVKKDEVIAFLEEQLTQIGFNDRERTDFITFWGPRMTQSEQGFVRFLVNEDYAEQVAALNISPKPDHIYRLYLLWTPLDETPSITPKPQKLPALQRGGLTIVEWGGSEVPVLQEL